MFGHQGRVLKVDLTEGNIQIERFGESFAKMFLGGNGFAAKLVHDVVPADADPLGPANALVFTVGPFADTPVWGTSRGHVGAISPQTRGFADSNFGGQFAVAQKRTGFDAIVVTGTSDRPVYLRVSDHGGELKDADEVWGKTTDETNALLSSREGRGAMTASIGPAGENGVVFASIVGGGGRHGVAGRGGMGAVMGSKNLKAVVAAGSRKTTVARPAELKRFLAEKRETLMPLVTVLTTHGTPMLVKMINDRGLLCTHNAAVETCDFADQIGSDVLKDDYIVQNTACYGCPVACGKKVRVPRGAYAGQAIKMPEYETLYALGSMMDNSDMVSIINGNGMCDRYGMDTISMGVTLAFVAECLEKGVVSEADLGGRVDFADGEAMVELIKATAMRDGIGDLLASGSQCLAERFGGQARRYLYTAKGMEIPGHSARGLRPLSVGYATATRGGTHHDARPKYLVPERDPGFDGQVEHSVRTQNFTAVGDSLIMCRLVEERSLGMANNDAVAEAINLVTGWGLDAQAVETIGERIYNLERWINVRRGLDRRCDTLPYRAMNEPIPSGPAKGRYCSQGTLDAMLDEYYRLRGWTADGAPSQATLAELGLV